MIDRLLQLCATAACRVPRTILVTAIVLAGLSTYYAATELHLNANTDDLIARDRPFMDDYLAFLHEFGDLEYLYVVIANDTDREQVESCIAYLAPRLKEIDVLPGVYHAVEVPEQLRIATRAMEDDTLREFVLAAEAYPTLRAQDGVDAALAAAREKLRELTRPGAGHSRAEQERLAAAAMLLLRTVAAGVPGSASEAAMGEMLRHDLEPQFIQSGTGRYYFIMILPVKDYGTMAVIEEPLRLIRQAIDEAREQFPDLDIGLTGKPVLQADEMATTERDMTRASILAIVLVSILFMIVIGGVWHPMLAVIALLCGIAWTFGLTTMTIGQLNLLSIVFTLVLVGVGIDFGVHMIARYKEQLRTQSIEESIRTALLTSGRGNITGAITSSIAFFMAMFTDFHGLRELGFIAGSGLLMCLTSMCIVLPAFLVVFDRWRERHPRRSPDPLPRRSRFEEHLWNWLLAHPGKVLFGAIVLTVLLAPGLLRIGFHANLLDLQAVGLESVKWERRILDDSAETWFGAVIVETQDEALDVMARAESHEWIGSTQSVFDIVQPDTPQRDALRDELQRRAAAGDGGDPGDAPPEMSVENLRQAASTVRAIADGAEGESPEEAAGMRELAAELEALADRLHEAEGEREAALRARLDEAVHRIGSSIDEMLRGDAMPLRDALPRVVRDRFLSERGRYLVKLHPVENVWDYEPMQRFVNAIRDIDPDATGVPITQFESFNDMQRAFAQAATFALMAVFVLLWLDQRRLRDAALAIMPLIIGIVWLIEMMGVIGVQFNLANFFAVPILIGIGVDSGIHIMRRYHEGGEQRLTLGSTRRAVFLTSMTSMIGFGCLATASHLGLRSLGYVMVLGCFSTLIASLIVLPVFLAWREVVNGRSKGKAHG